MQVSDDTPVGPRQLDTQELRDQNGGWSYVAVTAHRMTELVMAPYRAMAITPQQGENIARALRRHLDENFPTGSPWFASYEHGMLNVGWGPFSQLAAGLRREHEEVQQASASNAGPRRLRIVKPEPS